MKKKRIAIVGASANREKFGNKAVRAFQDAQWSVFPVNLREQVIEGIEVCKHLTEIPGPIDVVSLYLPPVAGLQVVDEIISSRPQEVFLNPGAENKELVDKLEGAGIPVHLACSMRANGLNPEAYGN